MKNKLSDLRDHLFAQMERLNDDGLKGQKLHDEIKRTQAMTYLAREITAICGLVLKGKIAVDNSVSGGIVCRLHWKYNHNAAAQIRPRTHESPATDAPRERQKTFLGFMGLSPTCPSPPLSLYS